MKPLTLEYIIRRDLLSLADAKIYMARRRITRGPDELLKAADEIAEVRASLLEIEGVIRETADADEKSEVAP